MAEPPTCRAPVPGEPVRHHYQAAAEPGVLWVCTECDATIPASRAR